MTDGVNYSRYKKEQRNQELNQMKKTDDKIDAIEGNESDGAEEEDGSKGFGILNTREAYKK